MSRVLSNRVLTSCAHIHVYMSDLCFCAPIHVSRVEFVIHHELLCSLLFKLRCFEAGRGSRSNLSCDGGCSSIHRDS